MGEWPLSQLGQDFIFLLPEMALLVPGMLTLERLELLPKPPTLPCRGRVLREPTNPDVEKAGSSIHLKPLGHTLCLCTSVSSS